MPVKTSCICGQTTIHTYLSAPEGLFAVVVKEPKGLYNIQYIHTDHLGSWNTISDAAATAQQKTTNTGIETAVLVYQD